MLSDVKNHVMNCNLCSAGMGKTGLSKSAPREPAVGRRAIPCDLHRYSIDIAGPIEQRSTRGYRYILSIVDMATRFQEAIPPKRSARSCSSCTAGWEFLRRSPPIEPASLPLDRW